MWYTRNKFYSETAEENLQEAKIACDAESPWTYNILSNQNHVSTSTTSLLQGSGCCDNWCWRCHPVEFLSPEFFGHGEKLRRVFMEQSQ